MTNTNKLTSTHDMTVDSSNARNHNVTVRISLNANDYETLALALPAKVHTELETKREIAIMHEVLQHEGESMIEKIDNTIDDWEAEARCETTPGYYKLQHRHLINSK